MTTSSPSPDDAALVAQIDMNLLQEIPSFNSRKEVQGVEELAANISITGQMMPVMVIPFSGLSDEERALCKVKKGKRFGLVVGHRRFAAINSLGWNRIEAKILPSSIDLKGAKILNLIENVQREDLSTYETAQSCLSLHKQFGMTHAEIASNLGKSRSYVGNLVRCCQKLAPEILGFWEEGDPQAIVDYLVVLAKVDHDTQRARWAQKKGLGVENGEGEEEGKEGEEEGETERSEPVARRRPSPKRLQALSDWVKENAPDAEMQRFAVSLIRMCQGEQSTLTIPVGKGKRKPKFDIRNPPKNQEE